MTWNTHCSSPARMLAPNTAVTVTGVVELTATVLGSVKAPAVPSTVWVAEGRSAGAGITTVHTLFAYTALGVVACRQQKEAQIWVDLCLICRVWSPQCRTLQVAKQDHDQLHRCKPFLCPMECLPYTQLAQPSDTCSIPTHQEDNKCMVTRQTCKQCRLVDACMG